MAATWTPSDEVAPPGVELPADEEAQPGASPPVTQAYSLARDTAQAVEEVLDRLGASRSALTLLFFSPRHDPAVVARLLDARCGERGIAGTTAGEVCEAGFVKGGVVGMSLCSSHGRAAVEILPGLDEVSLLPVAGLADRLAHRLNLAQSDLDPSHHLWLTLFDGLAGNPSLLTPFFRQASRRLDLVGGSLADGQRMKQIHLIHGGRTYRGAAAMILLEYWRPLVTFHHTHMAITDRWVEVTQVAQGGNVITSLDHRPALEVYRQMCGLGPGELDFRHTAIHPLGYRFRGRAFPCSVIRAIPGLGLQMAYPIQQGQQLCLLRSHDLVGSTHEILADARHRLRQQGSDEVHGMLLFHCLGRAVEAHGAGATEELFEALHQAPICGLNTYGEQFGTMHRNHALVGVLFG